MAFVYTYNGQTLTPGQPFVTVEGGEPIQHAPNALALYSADDLTRFGIVKTTVADPPAPVIRRELRKSLVQERLNTVGKWDAVVALLYDATGRPNIYYARWFAPDWPNVYADDAGLLQILGAAGLTADEIAQVTA